MTKPSQTRGAKFIKINEKAGKWSHVHNLDLQTKSQGASFYVGSDAVCMNNNKATEDITRGVRGPASAAWIAPIAGGVMIHKDLLERKYQANHWDRHGWA